MSNKWRLKRTLARQVEARPIEVDDLKYCWAAYRKGGLSTLGLPFSDAGMSAEEFRAAFENAIRTRYHAWWVVLGHTRQGFIPVGIIVGMWGPEEHYMIIVGIEWFSWASKRNIVEGTVKFFNMLRRQMKWMGFAGENHKRLYEICAMHGIMRRVGTTNMTEKPCAVFEGKN